MNSKKICVAGGHGLVGTSLVKRLQSDGYKYCASADKQIDLRDYSSVKSYLRSENPDCVILVAAKHGGIGEYASRPVEYFNDNLLICSSVITATYDVGIRKLVNIGASCVYGSETSARYTEEEYDKQAVQNTTEPYGLAKLAGMKLCEYYNKQYHTEYVSLLPVNMYGDGNGYKLDFSSVLPAMLQRFHSAKVNGLDFVEIWGDGKNTREFLFVDDFIDAVELVINTNQLTNHMFNVGGMENITINELSKLIAEVVGFKGVIKNDLSKPSGSSRGRLDSSKIRLLGWTPKITLKEGIFRLYSNYLKQKN
jgi:GDP-L-fucose synthase